MYVYIIIHRDWLQPECLYKEDFCFNETKSRADQLINIFYEDYNLHTKVYSRNGLFWNIILKIQIKDTTSENIIYMFITFLNILKKNVKSIFKLKYISLQYNITSST